MKYVIILAILVFAVTFDSKGSTKEQIEKVQQEMQEVLKEIQNCQNHIRHQQIIKHTEPPEVTTLDKGKDAVVDRGIFVTSCEVTK